MKKITLLFLLLFALEGFAQDNALVTTPPFPYPAGFYESYEDFQQRTPAKPVTFEASQLKNTLSTGFQLIESNGKRIKKAFAVSDGEKLYVRVSHMKKHFADKNKGNPIDVRRDYSPAYLVNDRYAYFENYFYSTGTAILGAGAMHLRGVLYKKSTGDFTVFKYGDDVKLFLESNYPEMVGDFDLSEKKINVTIVRSIMEAIFDKNK
ncbi:hypothetical protein [Sinomicrobium sp. M5D2P9]